MERGERLPHGSQKPGREGLLIRKIFTDVLVAFRLSAFATTEDADIHHQYGIDCRRLQLAQRRFHTRPTPTVLITYSRLPRIGGGDKRGQGRLYRAGSVCGLEEVV